MQPQSQGIEPESQEIERLTWPIKLTWEDYVELPEDGRRYEIIDGELYVSPSPRPLHQRVLFRLAEQLRAGLDARGLGETFIAPLDVLFGVHDIMQPDILFVRRDRLNIVDEENVKGIPDLVVEIISPKKRRRDAVVKARAYARLGVPVFWLVDPELERLEVSLLVDGRFDQAIVRRRPESYEPREFPGLVVDLEKLFA